MEGDNYKRPPEDVFTESLLPIEGMTNSLKYSVIRPKIVSLTIEKC